MIEENVLRDLYLAKNLTRKEIADKLSVSERHVKTYLVKYQIKKPKELLKEHWIGGHTTNHLWWTNGKDETCSIECPGQGWYRGRSDSTKKNQKLAMQSRKISEEGLENIRKAGSLRKGTHLSSEAKQKISEFWKNNEHPLKGKPRKKETREKISQKLMGHYQIAPKGDKIKTLTAEQCLKYIDKNNHINFKNLSKDLGISDNEDTRHQIETYFDNLNIDYKKHISTSISEKEILDYMKSIYNGNIIENCRNILPNAEIDIYVPEFKLGVEYNGNYWHRSMYRQDGKKFVFDSGKSPSYHQKKSLLARENGIRIIHIWEDQWQDTRLQPIIKGILKAALHLSDNNKIYARKCAIKEVPADEYKKFCDTHHTQLSRPAEIRLGLYYDGVLVQLMSFSKYKAINKRKVNAKYDYELVRGCESFNHSSVVGGVSKLLNYFIKTYDPNTIICYSDLNLFNGIGYEKAGFVLDSITSPDKFYVTNDHKLTRIKRSAKKYKEYMEAVVNKKLLCCYGAGNLKYVWKKP